MIDLRPQVIDLRPRVIDLRLRVIDLRPSWDCCDCESLDPGTCCQSSRLHCWLATINRDKYFKLCINFSTPTQPVPHTEALTFKGQEKTSNKTPPLLSTIRREKYCKHRLALHTSGWLLASSDAGNLRRHLKTENVEKSYHSLHLHHHSCQRSIGLSVAYSTCKNHKTELLLYFVSVRPMV